MKDSKSILLLVVSVLLILVSCALLWTWGYNFNNFAKDKPATVYIIKDSTSAANSTRDSLKRVYTATLNSIGTLDSTWSRADSLKGDLDLKLSEFYKLRNEIATLLKNPSKQADLSLAREKIGDLQKKIDQLRQKSTDVELENQRLVAALKALGSNTAEPVPAVKNVNFQTVPERVNKTSAVVSASTGFAVSDLRLSAIMQEGDKERETALALQTDKLNGTFVLKNNSTSLDLSEIIVVVLQPDGHVLQPSAWESGRFETRDGKKIYSCKVKFEYQKGESKRLSFSLNSDNFQKGTYSMQLYFNGVMIGSGSKYLG